MKDLPCSSISLRAAILLSAFATAAHADPGDFDLLRSKDGLDFGFLDSTSVYPMQLGYDHNTKATIFEGKQDGTTFLWRETAASNQALKSKLMLDASNEMSLYKSSDGTTAGLVLNPNTSRLTFTGTDGGLMHSTGGSVLRFSSNGTPLFDKAPSFLQGASFSQGASFGSGGTLDSGKVGYLQGMLTGFGYQQDLGATAVTKIDLAGDVVITDYDGSCYVGHYSGVARIGPHTLPDSGTRRSGFVFSLASNGTPQTPRIYTSTGDLQILSVASGSRGLLIGGSFTGTTTCFPGYDKTSAGGTDGFLDYRSSSQEPWTKFYGGPSDDAVTAVAIDWTGFQGQGDFPVVGGYFQGTAELAGDGDEIPDPLTVTSVSGSRDGFLISYDLSNNHTLNSFNIIGSSGSDSVTDIASTPWKTYLVAAGVIGGNTSTLPSGKNMTRAGSSDGFLLRLNDATTIAWTKPLGGTGADSIAGVQLDSSGKIYVEGQFTGTTTNFGGSNNLTSLGDTDGFAARLDPVAGAMDWSQRVGSTSTDKLTCGWVDSANGLTVGGEYGATLSSGMPASYPNRGGSDLVILKLNSATGAVQTVETMGTVGYDTMRKVACEGVNSVYRMAVTCPESLSFGDTILLPARSSQMLAQWSGLPVSTRATGQSPAPFQWGTSLAEGTSAVAVGTLSYSSGNNSFAAAGGISSGTSSTALGRMSHAIGDFSLAGGIGTEALGTGSSAFGEGTSAAGDYSVASGLYSVASGYGAVAFGEESHSTGYGSFAAGGGASATGDYSFASGLYSVASGYGAVAFGEESQSTGYGSFAAGGGASATAGYATAFGSGYATGEGSFAAGFDAGALGISSAAFGMSVVARSYGGFATGVFNLGIDGDPSEWSDGDPLFEIGNGLSSSSRSNAVTTLKNGKTTLTNRAWLANGQPLENPDDENDSDGEALEVNGHTRLNGKVIITQPQGDISMGIYE